MIKKIRYKLLYIDLTIILAIILLILFATDYKFGQMIQTGDLRLHLDSSVMGDQFTNLFSKRFSNNNYVYLSIMPLFKIFEFMGYNFSVFYLYVGIFVISYLSIKYSTLALMKEFNIKTDISITLFISSLAFFFSLNPYSLNRIGHYTVLHSISLYPLLYLYIIKTIKNSKLRDYFIFYLVLFFSNSSPQNLIFNIITVVSLPVIYSLLYRVSLKNFIYRYLKILIFTLITILHILLPVYLGMGVSKSIFESPTDANVLKSLSRNSNIFTSISGTNYYYDKLLNYPLDIGLGALLFIILILSFLYLKNYADKFILLNIVYFIGFLIIIGGYKTYPIIFEYFITNEFISSYLWVIKDPNMYFGFFIFYLSVLLVYQFSHVKNTKFLSNLSVLLIILNILFYISTDTKDYRSFYDFISVPDIYNDLSYFLDNSEYRNLWLPYNTYVSKNYSNDIYYFPIPAFWLTKNKELTEYTPEFRYMINLIEHEIYNKDCINKTFISWLLKTNNLNIILDKSTVNHPHIKDDQTINKLLMAEKCMKSINTVVVSYSDKNISSYISNLPLSPDVYEIVGDIDYLINNISNNPSNVYFIVTGEKSKFSYKKIDNNIYILNESYNSNWRDKKNMEPLYRINLVNMAFKDNGFKYRGTEEFDFILFLQDLVIIVSIFYIVYTFISNHKKYHE